MIGSAEALDVVYRTPLGTRWVSALSRGTCCLLVFVAVSMACIGIWTIAIRAAKPPLESVMSGLGLGLCSAIAAYIVRKRHLPSRLALRIHGLRAGGIFLGRDMPYESLRLIKIEHPNQTVGNCLLLTLHAARGSAVRVWMRGHEAEECFTALRALCEHVAAIGRDDDVQMPNNAAFTNMAKAALRMEYQRQARRALVAAVCFAAISLIVVGGFVFGSANAHPRAYFMALVFPLGCLAWVARYRASKRLEREAGCVA